MQALNISSMKIHHIFRFAVQMKVILRIVIRDTKCYQTLRLPKTNIFEQTILLQFLSGSVRSRASMCIHLMHIFKQYETK